jgi:hypothetical protein
MSVYKITHYPLIPNAFAISSGKMSKSSAILIFPFNAPGFLSFLFDSYFTNLATGFPAFPMMISSPAITFSIKPEK